ncbi:MAG: SCP2 sterol-binding domain-containing protein, partial [Solirubrobacterales bacterium]|nr:SCP2 sterol-binding domain-containing protein [Solirubrobacterales bacterium]
FGFTLQDIFAQGAEALDGRLRAAGLDPGSMRLGLPFDVSPAERAHRGLTLLRAGYLGEPNGRVTPNPEATAMLFDGLRRQIRPSAAPGTIIQWDFSDAEPWHLRIDDGTASVAPGRAERPDLTLRCRFADWVDITAGRIEPWRALVTGKLRPSGRPSMLVRARKLFG